MGKEKLPTLFLVFVVFHAILVLVDRVFIVGEMENLDAIWLSGVLAISVVFMLYFAWTTIKKANIFDFYGFFVITIVLTSRISLEFFWRASWCEDSSIGGLCMGMLLACMVFQVIYFAMAPFMHNEIRWRFYKKVGAEPKFQESYLTYQRFATIKKVDLQFSVVIVWSAAVFFNTNATLLGITVGALLLELAWEYFTVVGIKNESQTMMRACYAIGTILPVFCMFVIYDALIDRTRYEALDLSAISIVATTAICSIITRILLVFFMHKVSKNFGLGMREKIFAVL